MADSPGIFMVSQAEDSSWVRVVAAVVFLLALTPIALASTLRADSRGVGTHEQLGMRACGFVEETGMPCATCGMTTAFALAADGRLLDAFLTQPAGAVFALLAAMAVLVSGYALVTGMDLSPVFRWLWRPRVVLMAGFFVILAWAYKIAIHREAI